MFLILLGEEVSAGTAATAGWVTGTVIVMGAVAAAYVKIKEANARTKVLLQKAESEKRIAENKADSESKQKEHIQKQADMVAVALELRTLLNETKRDLQRHVEQAQKNEEKYEKQMDELRQNHQKLHDDHSRCMQQYERQLGINMMQEQAIARLQAKVGDEFPSLAPTVITATSDGTIIDISPAAASLFEYMPGELIGKSVEILVPEDLRSGYHRGMDRLKSGVFPWPEKPVITEAVTQNKNRIPIVVFLKAWKNAEGGIVVQAQVRSRMVSEVKDGRSPGLGQPGDVRAGPGGRTDPPGT